MIVLLIALFTIIGIKSFDVHANEVRIKELYLTPGGETIGIEVSTKVIVVDSYSVESAKGTYVNPAAVSGIRKGDIILNIDGRQINQIEDVKAVLKSYKSSQKESLNIIVKRESRNISTKITPIETKDGTISLGLYLKDHILGIGTLTFTYQDYFGALGHQIKDHNRLLDEKIKDEGVIKKAVVTNIVKGKTGQPGEKKASMQAEEVGIIQENTITGIFGILKEDFVSREAMQIKAKEDVRVGDAQILTVIDGEKVESFDIKIVEVKDQATKDVKGMKIKVTDDRLIEQTGGIIQGMSGSPIIQDGKIVGAVTHVLINDQTMGYGIFIEFMLEEIGIKVIK